jgi:Na+/H+ antiporter NhaD/arsenite permease-like protein
MTFDVTAAGVIFLLTYIVIVSEKIHRTAVALGGGLLLILLGIVTQEDAFLSIDLNVIFLLVGMMVIAALMAETGVFPWMAVRAVQLGRGSPVRIMVILALITALTSSLLNNVTVIVLIAPVALFVASSLGVSPVPFLITSVMASNIGGAATLVGDPPNILIGSEAQIDFLMFLVNMGPPVVICLLVYVPVMVFQFRRDLEVDPKDVVRVRQLTPQGMITEPVLLRKSLFVLGLVLIAFLLEGLLDYDPATIALSGATLLLIVTRKDPSRALAKVEWSTLMFFVGLFIVVEAVVEVGIIAQVGGWLINLTQGNLRVTMHLVLWFSAIASGIVDNIPYTATMLPLINSLSSTMDILPLWWALALGADFGGNLTLVGSSANIVAADLAEGAGFRIPFTQFLKYGLSVVFVTLLVSSVWLELVYL